MEVLRVLHNSGGGNIIQGTPSRSDASASCFVTMSCKIVGQFIYVIFKNIQIALCKRLGKIF